MKQSSHFSLIILCYNDSLSLPELVEQSVQVLSENFEAFEIIIVDDASSDQSREVILECIQQYPCVKKVFHTTNQGVGATFQSGIQEAQYDLVAYIDGDLQYDPKDLIALSNFTNGQQMNSGTRRRRADPLHRKVVSFCYNTIVRTLYHLPIRDVNGGIKVFQREAILKTFPLVSTGPFYDAEVMIRFKSVGMDIGQVEVSHYPRKYGRPGGIKPANLKKVFQEIIDHRFTPYRVKTLKSRLTVTLLKLLVRIIR